MLTLYDTMKQRIFEITRSQYSIQVLDAIFDKPIFQTSDFVKKDRNSQTNSSPYSSKIEKF